MDINQLLLKTNYLRKLFEEYLEELLGFLENNSLYIVLFIILTIWVGIFTYLNILDKRLKTIEVEMKEPTNEE